MQTLTMEPSEPMADTVRMVRMNRAQMEDTITKDMHRNGIEMGREKNIRTNKQPASQSSMCASLSIQSSVC
jgi:hypothetical protein